MNALLRASPDAAVHKAQLTRLLRAAARSHIHAVAARAADCTAIYTLADPRDARCPRYVGQTRDPRRRFAQHLHTARLWLIDDAGMDARGRATQGAVADAGMDARGRAMQEQLPIARGSAADGLAESLWWVRSPKYRPLYDWIRALYRDGGRLPFMWVAEWVEPGTDPLAAERGAIMRLLAQGAELLNVEARLLGAQLPLL